MAPEQQGGGFHCIEVPLGDVPSCVLDVHSNCRSTSSRNSSVLRTLILPGGREPAPGWQ
jgi:hypothetical protein